VFGCDRVMDDRQDFDAAVSAKPHATGTASAAAVEPYDGEYAPEGAADAVARQGVALVRGLLSEDVCRKMLASVTNHHVEVAERADSGEDAEERWFSQRYPYRDDVLLPLELPGLRLVLAELLRVLAAPLAELVGWEANLVELAAHISLPGAQPQSFHTDHPWTSERQVVTCFVALHDVPPDLGPTEVFPGTHTAPAHVHSGYEPHGADACPADGSQCLCATDSLRRALALHAGDVALMDARLVHRGGSRLSGRQGLRALLYFTVQRRGTSYGHEHTPSMLPEYIERLPLDGWEEWVESGVPRPSPTSLVSLWLKENVQPYDATTTSQHDTTNGNSDPASCFEDCEAHWTMNSVCSSLSSFDRPPSIPSSC